MDIMFFSAVSALGVDTSSSSSSKSDSCEMVVFFNFLWDLLSSSASMALTVYSLNRTKKTIHKLTHVGQYKHLFAVQSLVKRRFICCVIGFLFSSHFLKKFLEQQTLKFFKKIFYSPWLFFSLTKIHRPLNMFRFRGFPAIILGSDAVAELVDVGVVLGGLDVERAQGAVVGRLMMAMTLVNIRWKFHSFRSI